MRSAAVRHTTGARAGVRRGGHTAPTSGLADGDTLGLLRLRVRNPVASALLQVTDTGLPRPTGLATDTDLRTADLYADVPVRWASRTSGERITDQPGGHS